MKAKIHPQWFAEATVVCSCGNTFTVGSTKSEIRVEICSKCHPFYTGSMRLADTEGKVDSFVKKMAAAKTFAPELARKKAKKLNLPPTDTTGPKTLKEMLMGVK